jgi:digeranylgeranylglycerophospholipid reductase
LKRPDVIIVGAGSAGCVTARRCAELGLRTLLLDRKELNTVGQKVCGDEISKSHFEETGIEPPNGKEISQIITGADVYPPSMKNELRVRGWKEFDGWTVNRLEFGQRLLNEAIDAGVVFREKSHVKGPILRGEHVTGVELLDLDTKEESSLTTKLVIDASGFASVIRKKLETPFVEPDIAKEDVALCYREILKLKVPLAEPHVARVLLGGIWAPQGYAWIFPKGKQAVNAGVGIGGGEGKGSPKAYFEELRENYPLFFGSKVIEGKGGAVPVRRPVSSLVANGVAFVGDAAFQVNPIHGGGIGAGMRAGIILAEVAKVAVARNDTSAKRLWNYNVRYLSGFGSRLASLEIFRRLLQSVSDEDMDFGFEKRILEANDLMTANRGDGISLSINEKMKRLGRGISRIGLLLKIQKASKIMKRISQHYQNYPSSPDSFDMWKAQDDSIIQDAVF